MKNELATMFFSSKCKHHFLKKNDSPKFVKFRQIFIEILAKYYDFDSQNRNCETFQARPRETFVQIKFEARLRERVCVDPLG